VTPPVTILNVGYRSTNFWVVSAGKSRLLVDLGWPGTMGEFRAILQRMDVPLAEIRYGLATHYHIDHAGLAQDLKNAGVRLLVPEVQVQAIPAMKQWTKPRDHYTEISPEGNVVIPVAGGRTVLEGIGIGGEIVHTPGHSDDSVYLLLDDGSVFAGDLTFPRLIGEDERGLVAKASWRLLKEKGARTVYPGHGNPWPLKGPVGASLEA